MSTPGFGLYFRRYAPFEKFGIPSFKGDSRTEASTSLRVSSRTYGCVLFNQFEVLNSFAGSSGTEDANLILHGLERKKMAKVSFFATRDQEEGPGLISFTASTAGSNPLMPGAPDIDTKVHVRVDWGASNAMKVNGKVEGDDFPNLEVFIRCYQSGNSALLVDGRTTRNRYTGPMSLFGSGATLCTFLATIPLSDKGTFVGEAKYAAPIEI
jgi:hypothetical protein